MNLEQVRELAYKHLGQRKSHRYREEGFIYYHGQRVGNLAINLRHKVLPQVSDYDDIITVAGWFHDVGKGIEPHWEYGAILAKEILADYCQPKKLDMIVEAIGKHTLRRQDPQDPDYVKLVQDADILDHFGGIEIWLNFSHSALSGRNLAGSLDFYDQHYDEHIIKVRELLNYPESVQIFDEKDQFVRAFIQRLRIESEGNIYC